MLTNSDTYPNKTVKIWGVLEGPMGMDDDGELVYVNLCKIEIDGKVEHVEYYFDNFDDAYEMVKHFQTKIEPLEVTHGD
tara:strand:- start:128 stop:364 length:237 start_codon:yes stop_codon:yes gene_type:complete